MSYQTGYEKREGTGERCSDCGKPINGDMIVEYIQVSSKTIAKNERGKKKDWAYYHPMCKSKRDMWEIALED